MANAQVAGPMITGNGMMVNSQTMGFNPTALQDLQQITGHSWAGLKRDPLELFVGSQMGGRRYVPQDSMWRGHSVLSEAYKGQSVFMGEFIMGLLVYDNLWYTSEICSPIDRTDQINWRWNVLAFERNALDRVPEEGVMRTHKTSQTMQTARSIRHGRAIVVEDGHMHTPEGQTHMVRSLQQVQNATQETLAQHVMLAILSAKDDDVRLNAQMGLLNKPTRTLLLDRANDAFALQKSGNAARTLVVRKREVLAYRQVEPNLLIVPRGFDQFFVGLGPENREYQQAGPEALARRNNPTPWNISSFMGLNLAFCGTFVNSLQFASSIPVCPLVRRMVFGGYNLMRDTQLMATHEPQTDMAKRAIKVYDMTADAMRKITILEALRACAPYTFRNGRLPKNFMYPYAGTKSAEGNLTWGDLPEEFLTQAQWDGLAAAARRLGLRANNNQPPPAIANQLQSDLEPLVFAKAAVPTKKQIKARAAELGRGMQEVLGGEETSGRMLPENLEGVLLNTYTPAEAARVMEHVGDLLQAGNKEALEAHAAAHITALVGAKQSTKAYSNARKGLLGPKGAPDESIKLVPKDQLEKMVLVDPVSGGTSSVAHEFDPNEPSHVELAKALGIEDTGIDMAAVERAGIRAENGDDADGGMGAAMGDFHNYEITYDDLERIAREGGTPFPFNFLLVRPWTQVQAATGVMMRGGRETMRTHVGHPAVMVGDQASNQTHIWTFTIFAIANVYRKEAITYLENMAMRGYISGHNKTFFTYDELNELADANWDVRKPKFSHENSPSFVSLMIPGTLDEMDKVISIRGYLSAAERNSGERHFPTADYYSEKLQWDTIPDPDPERPNDSPLNAVCIQSHTVEWDPDSQKMRGVVINQGHFGCNVYEGCRRVFEGREDVLKEQNYNRITLIRELA